MTAESRITRSPGTRAMPGAMKASKLQIASSISASAPLKRHVPAPMLKSTKGTSAKTSPSTSSSDSSSGKRGLDRGKAISNRKISQGTKDAPADAKVSSSESSAETTGTEFEASNELSLECVEPDETKRIIDMAEPSLLIPELQLTNVDVVHSNLAASWFNVDDHEFYDFMNTKADQDCHMTGAEKQNPLSAAAEETATPNSLLESINNGYMDEFEGAIGRVYSIDTPLQQDKKCEDGKAVVEEFTGLSTPDVTECSEGKDNSRKYEDGSTLQETSEGTVEVKLAGENLMRQAGHGLDAFRGWRAIKVLLPMTLVVLLMVLLYVDNLVELGELGMLPPPT